jgi:hypothetical protein
MDDRHQTTNGSNQFPLLDREEFRPSVLEQKPAQSRGALPPQSNPAASSLKPLSFPVSWKKTNFAISSKSKNLNIKSRNMKSFFLLLVMSFLFTVTQAQLLKTTAPVKDSVVNTDNSTINLGSATNDVVSVHLTGTRASGTVAGKVYLDASIDGSNYTVLDSVTLSNGANVWAPFQLTKLWYSQYRLRISSTGTVKVTAIKGHYLRRSL